VVKDNAIVNALNRTKEEKFPDLAAFQEQRATEHRAKQKQKKVEQSNIEKQMKREREELARQRRYEDVMIESNMKSNLSFEASVDDSAAKDYEDDFM
jgi:hypothetical protein